MDSDEGLPAPNLDEMPWAEAKTGRLIPDQVLAGLNIGSEVALDVLGRGGQRQRMTEALGLITLGRRVVETRAPGLRQRVRQASVANQQHHALQNLGGCPVRPRRS